MIVSPEPWPVFFPANLRRLILAEPEAARRAWREIRVRAGQPLQAIAPAGELNLGGAFGQAVTAEDLQATFQLMTQHSVYALEEELRQGFITLPGGHRLGFTGHAVLEGGRIRLLRQVSSLHLRLARSIPGAGLPLLPALVKNGALLSTLILSPPGCGKTTLLRDLVRLASLGRPDLGLPGLQVSLVDERSEVAGTYLGRPQLDVGPRTDVLDGAPKAEGISLMLRAMGPQVLATDEIGRPEDAEAVAEAAKAGVAVLATAHAGSPEEAGHRPILGRILAGGYFQRLVVLDASRGPGTVRGLYEPVRQPQTGVSACSVSWAPCASWPARAVSAV
ncbi:MAG: stage III sporulation protein AA [Patescibacteria group bacterium]